LNREINAGLTSPPIQAKYADFGTILTISPTEFRKLVTDDVAKWAVPGGFGARACPAQKIDSTSIPYA
jgi:hypothetical protein